MAKATATTRIVEKADGVTLKLSPEEALALAVLTAAVAGLPRSTARKYTAAINDALCIAGYTYTRVASCRNFDALFDGTPRIAFSAEALRRIEEAAK